MNKSNVDETTSQCARDIINAFWSDSGELRAGDIVRRVEDVVPAVVLGRRVLRFRMSGAVPIRENLSAISRALPAGWSVSCELHSEFTANAPTRSKPVLWVVLDIEQCARHPLAGTPFALIGLTVCIFAIVLLFIFRFFYIW